MGRHVSVAGLLVFAIAASGFGGEVLPQKSRGSSSAKTPAPRFDRYQVAAGTALLLKLRTAISSASTSPNEQVEATLWSPVIQDGVELVPEGSVVLGKVVTVTRASDKMPAGAIAFVFSVIEHAGTGSREALITRAVLMQAVPEPETGRGRGKRPKPVDVVAAEGTSFVAVTAEPLLVRIPR